MGKKVSKIEIKEINSIWLSKPLVFDVYFEDVFYTPVTREIEAQVRESDCHHYRIRGFDAIVKCIEADSMDKLRNKLRDYYTERMDNNITEEKLIQYDFKFNLKAHRQMSFAGHTAIELSFNIYYLVTYPDGRKVVLSYPYKEFASICSNKSSDEFELFKKRYTWMEYTAERYEFFKNTRTAMEMTIEKVDAFFNQDVKLLASAIDNNVKLLGN